MFTLIPVCLSDHIHYKVWGEFLDTFPKFYGETLEVWEWISDSSCTLLSIRLLIHAGIEVNPCQ